MFQTVTKCQCFPSPANEPALMPREALSGAGKEGAAAAVPWGGGGSERLFHPSPVQIVSPESTQGPELPKCRCFQLLGVLTGGCCLPGCPPCSVTSWVPWHGCQPLVCAVRGFQPNCLVAGLGQGHLVRYFTGQRTVTLILRFLISRRRCVPQEGV